MKTSEFIKANYSEIKEKLIEILKEHDLNRDCCEVDVYLYNRDNKPVLDTFLNCGGNSWLDDDHYTLGRLSEYYDNSQFWECFNSISMALEELGLQKDDVIGKIDTDMSDWDEEEINTEIEHYLCREYSDKISKIYKDLQDSEWADNYDSAAESMIDLALDNLKYEECEN